ncbi:hypothetical protein F4808DRAFT_450557 [Astrocystis sublimbata]|nr:hypothetical protein F4808DRAFT_450557 [Astrocystis sublimbata]
MEHRGSPGYSGYGAYHPSHPPQGPPPPPQQYPALELLIFRNDRHTQTVRAAGRPDALLVLSLPQFDKPELKAFRVHKSGENIATARLHDVTTSKADMTLWGRHERWKKEYDSFSGLGHLCWEPSGERGYILEQNGRLLARYSVNTELQKKSKKSCGSLNLDRYFGLSGSSSEGQGEEAEARLEIYAHGLSREQLEEIVFSCAVEKSRFERYKKNASDAKIAGKLIHGLG